MSSGIAGAPLKMVCDFDPGLHRVGSSGAFAYVNGDGSAVDDAETLKRIRSLVIPPAWTRVWIAADPAAHLQATGIDSRGRKQYRYHPEWLRERDDVKFHDMEDFARAQPALRVRISEALSSDERLGHRRVSGLALRLLDVGLFRVGSDRYARDNGHYGLTTLRRDQVAVRGGAAQFDYVGKAGKRHRLSIVDAPAVEVLRALTRRRDAPDELLVFLGRDGPTRIHREDVNNFLRAESGGPFLGQGIPHLERHRDRGGGARLRAADDGTRAGGGLARSCAGARQHARGRAPLVHRSARVGPLPSRRDDRGRQSATRPLGCTGGSRAPRAGARHQLRET